MTATLPYTTLREALRGVSRGPSVLALDYDGTLALFRVERSEARPPPELRTLLQRLAASEHTRVVVVSGRPIAELVQLLDLDPLPELFGVHGWEHVLPGGTRADHALPKETVALLEEEWRRLQDEGDVPRVERKSASLAVHWRGLPTAEAVALEARIGGRWRDLAGRHGLELRPFDGGLELRHPGRSKGDVIDEILDETQPGATVAYLGDDETDEDAFRAVAGRGLGVLVADEPRPTAATTVIAHTDVARFLAEWLSCADGLARDADA